jgi:hypothetical protein
MSRGLQQWERVVGWLCIVWVIYISVSGVIVRWGNDGSHCAGILNQILDKVKELETRMKIDKKQNFCTFFRLLKPKVDVVDVKGTK